MSEPAGQPGPFLFHTEDVAFDLEDTPAFSEWLLFVTQQEGKYILLINYIFCSDVYLHHLNLEYLQHDTFTDIITFPYEPDPIEADIFISVERVSDNADHLGLPFKQELARVMVHGLLHLFGYSDKDPEQKSVMRTRENEYLEYLRRELHFSW